jgi:parallel beta-helix repeat protein
MKGKVMWYNDLLSFLAPVARRHKGQRSRRKTARCLANSSRLRLELLEDRLAPATITVTTPNDNGDNAHPLAGSLRNAILQADTHSGDTINFNIGAATILPVVNPLPAITSPMTIDGASNITIDGSNAPRQVGLTVAANGCHLAGLTIQHFQFGVLISGNNNFINSNCNISSNVQWGVGIWAGDGNTIDGNYVNDNGEVGIGIVNGSDNMIRNNTISNNGLTWDRPDGDGAGVAIDDYGPATDNNIVTGNTITGNLEGVFMSGGPRGNQVVDNVAISSNSFAGVQIGGDIGIPQLTATSSNTVSGNTIANNGSDGVELLNGPDSGPGVTDNYVVNNTITGNGTNLTGGNGVVLDGHNVNSNHLWGNTISGSLGSGDTGHGITITGGANSNEFGDISHAPNFIHDNAAIEVLIRDHGLDFTLAGLSPVGYSGIADGPAIGNAITVGSDTSAGLLIDGTGTSGGNRYTIDFGPDLVGPVTVMGAAGDNLVADGGTGNNTINKTHTGPGQGFITWTDGASALETIGYSGVFDQTLNLNGSGTNNVNDPADHTTINGGPGNNVFVITATVGDGVVLNGGPTTNTYQIELGSLAGPVVINNPNPGASDRLIVDGAPGDNAIVASGNTVTEGAQIITLNAPLAAATINGGSGINHITVADLTVPIQSLKLNGGPGVNTFTLVDVGSSVGSLAVQSPPGATNQFDVQGDVPAGDASLMGFVFEDFNDDGQIDYNEMGIGGVQLRLQGTDDLGQTVDLDTTTDSDGRYQFVDLRPGAYRVIETQPDGYAQGIDSVGTAGGSLAGTDEFLVSLAAGVHGLNYNFGERPANGGAVQHGQTAGIGFWNNKNGQALIKSLNGGPASKQLGNWLADTFPNIYGASAGTKNLAGKTNAFIAALFQSDFVQKGQKLDAQVLATALSVYVTNATLDNTDIGAQYGFLVQGDGVGTATVNVGSNGDAVGVGNGTTLTVLDTLLAADAQAIDGVLYHGDAVLRKKANDLFSFINQAGSI